MVSQSLDEDGHSSEAVTAFSGWSWLLIVALLLPAIVAFSVLFRLTLPAPYQDDYDAIFGFACDYEQLAGVPNKILAIATEQHNEYKLAFEHVIVAMELETTHHLNFTFLTVLGNLQLLPVGYMLWRTYASSTGSLDHRLLAFLPISFCFFSLTYWENLNWAVTGLQNTPIIFFSLLAIYLVAREDKWSRTQLLLGCLVASLAAFTSANGFLLFPVGLLIFLPRRAWAASLAWCAAFVLPLAAYLYHYTPSVHPANRLFFMRPLFFLAFLGGAIPNARGALLTGVLIFAVLLASALYRFDRVNPTAFYFMLWILATGCLVAWVRGVAAYFIASRYTIYSLLLFIYCYSFLACHLIDRASPLNRRRFYATAIAVSVVFCVMSDASAYRGLAARRRMVLSGIELYRANPDLNSPMIDPKVDQAFPLEKDYERRMLTEAIREEIYAFPARKEIR